MRGVRNMRFQADEALQIYIDESRDHLADFEHDLLTMERQGPNLDDSLINKVFRGAHSIKGGAGLLGFTKIKELAFKIENLLGLIRDRSISPDSAVINILMQAADTLKDMLVDPSSSDAWDISAHIEALTILADNTPSAAQATPNPTSESKIESRKQTPSKDNRAEDTETLQIYIDESHEHLAGIENDILAIERSGADIDEDLVNKVFRSAHSIKGGAGFLGLVNIKKLAHKIENLLGLIRSRELVVNAEIIDVLLQSMDGLRNLINNISASNDIDISPQLQALADVTAIEPHPNKGPRVPDREQLVEKKSTLKEKTLAKPAAITKTAPLSTLRVKTSLLDSLMNLAGELVLSRNQLLQAASAKDLHHFETVSQRIDLITSDLQEAIMHTRMQPIGNIFCKFPRMIRDLAHEIGKEVELILVGEDVELDKTIIEAISDPLTHLVRNAIDHGIELPAERRANNKPVKGKVVLSAAHEASSVIIEIQDDGHGLDGDAFARKAVELGILSLEQSRGLSAKEKLNLILQPGFSMATRVTDISGRGVGMDVVKNNFEKLGGQINISSRLGKGTTITIKLPLTLTIITSQVIRNNGERYAIPQANLMELVRVPANEIKHRIERIGNVDVVRLRDDFLPLVTLSSVLGVETHYVDPDTGAPKKNRRKNISDRRSRQSPLFKTTTATWNENSHLNHRQRIGKDRRSHPGSALNIIIVSSGTMKYGLVVDELLDSEEIVVKPLGHHLKSCAVYAGATIMGDGRISLILDVGNIAQAAGLTSIDECDRAHEINEELAKAAKNNLEKQALLVFRSNVAEQFAVPLNQVVRIEKIKKTQIEEIGNRRVMQYRGTSLLLFSIDEVVKAHPLAEQENFLVLIFRLVGHEVGLLATNPINTLELSVNIDDHTHRQFGVIGSALIDGHITLFINVYDIFKTLNPEWFAERVAPTTNDGKGVTILIVEDSNFFRKQVKSFLESENYQVVEAEDGLIALDTLAEYKDTVSIVITDIEMPNLDGFALTEEIKNRKEYHHLPVVALTTLAGEKDMARGREVGIDEYLIKLDKENLLATIHDLLSRQGRNGARC